MYNAHSPLRHNVVDGTVRKNKKLRLGRGCKIQSSDAEGQGCGLAMKRAKIVASLKSYLARFVQISMFTFTTSQQELTSQRFEKLSQRNAYSHFTMPKAKPAASLSGLVDTDMEDDTLNMDAFPTPDSNQENIGSAKKKGRPAKATAKKFTKTKATGRRTSRDSIPPKKAAPKKKAGVKRAPLKEQTNVQHAEDTEEVDEFAAEGNDDMAMDELVETKQPAKRKAPAKKAGKQSKKKHVDQVNVVEEQPAQQPKAMEKDGEFEYTPTATRQTKRPGRPAAQKPKANMRQTSVEPPRQERIIPETQVVMDIDQSEPLEEDEYEDTVPQSVFRRTNNARDNTHQRQPAVARRRAGSASDNERGGNAPAMRRKLGEMTKKFETLDMKYRTLREEGIKEASANFEKYKTHTQASAKGRAPLSNPITTVLTIFSCERSNHLTEERTRYSKNTIQGLSISRE